MEELADENIKVDMVLTDLPYGTTQNKWDTIIPFEAMWEGVHSITNPNTPLVFFSQMPFTIKLADSNIKEFRYEWIWEKEQGTGYLNSKRMPLKIHENILVFYQKLPYYNPQMRDNEKRTIHRNDKTVKTTNYGKHIEIQESQYIGRYPVDIIKFNRNKNNTHPTQKPVELLEYLIRTYTKPNDTVLDFTMSSGSTGVACQNTNRKFIGIELNKEYYDIAVERLNNKQTKLI